MTRANKSFFKYLGNTHANAYLEGVEGGRGHEVLQLIIPLVNM